MSDTATPTQDALVQLTPVAVTKMAEQLAGKPEGGIRLGVAGGGCAGLQYQLDVCDAPNPEDIVQTIEGIRVFMHPMVVPYLKGITLDFSTALMDGGFKFINPNATNTCGCGTSFGV